MDNELLINLFYENIDETYTFSKIRKSLATLHLSDEEIKKELDALRLSGTIFFDDKNDVYKAFPYDYYVGRVVENKKGSYSLVIGTSKYSIKKELLSGALNNDMVVATKKSNGQYSIIQVLKRGTNKIVCEVKTDDNNKKYLVPCKIGYTFNVDIGSRSIKKLLDGQIVTINIGTEKYEDAYCGELIEVIGHRTDPDIELKTIAIANGFNPKFNDDTLEQVKSIPLEVHPEDLKGRLDLRDKMIFTMDGEHTKDIDDAISIEKKANGHYILGVHIAHVSNYVKLNTPIFNEAATRGNSLYMLDTVIPMLPRELSNGICSLNEDVDRLTRSVIIEYDETGKRIDYRIVKSVIHSKKKMTYEKVNEILENDVIPEGYEPFVNDLKIMSELSDILTKKKNDRGYIGFASEEMQFDFDENGNPIKINKIVPKTSNHIIENFMIEANCAVAEYVYWQRRPFVYRNHGVPDSERLFETVHLLKLLGYRILKLKHVDDPGTIQTILSNLTNREEYPILSTLLLRSMEKAYYGTDNIGHFGLSLGCYTHYTSPIRRLSDLIVHTLLDLYEDGLDVSDQLFLEIKKYCEVASMQERNADIAEYQAYKLACIKLMQNNIGQEYEAFISDITPKNVKIKLENGIEGIIDFSKLGYAYQYKEENKAIFIKNHDTLLIGKKLTVSLYNTSMENLELYFAIPSLENNMKRTRTLS